MSLFVVGSVSRITSNIVTRLAQEGKFSTITIADLLPSYEYHNRFYRLQRQLEHNNIKVNLNLTRLTNINDILSHKKYDDVLYVTHDYYENVTSKTKLMQLTALACKMRKHLYFATPVQYDHFGFANPEDNYNRSEDKVFQINPNSTIIRSDIQDSTQALTGLKQSSNPNFKPKIVRSQQFTKAVSDAITSRIQGKRILVRGTEVGNTRNYNKNIEQSQYKHSRENLTNLLSKYSGLSFSGYNGQERATRTLQHVQKSQKKQKIEKSSH